MLKSIFALYCILFSFVAHASINNDVSLENHATQWANTYCIPLSPTELTLLTKISYYSYKLAAVDLALRRCKCNTMLGMVDYHRNFSAESINLIQESATAIIRYTPKYEETLQLWHILLAQANSENNSVFQIALESMQDYARNFTEHYADKQIAELNARFNESEPIQTQASEWHSSLTNELAATTRSTINDSIEHADNLLALSQDLLTCAMTTIELAAPIEYQISELQTVPILWFKACYHELTAILENRGITLICE